MWASQGTEIDIGSTHASILHHTTFHAGPPGGALGSTGTSAPSWGVPGSAWHFTSWVKCRKTIMLIVFLSNPFRIF